MDHLKWLVLHQTALQRLPEGDSWYLLTLPSPECVIIVVTASKCTTVCELAEIFLDGRLSSLGRC